MTSLWESTTGVAINVGFCFIVRLIYTGFKRPLTDADLWALNKSNKAATVVPSFIKKWKEAESSLR